LGRLAHGGDQRARLALSFPLGLIGALMRVSDNRFATTVATVYVEIVRNIPLLVVL
jgi:His/Glu/Gln/Arg/opine family amino acid ABC transporter permease subunit